MTVPPTPAAPSGPVPARRPSTLGGLAYLVMVAVCTVGLAMIAFGPWRRGATVIGIALIGGAVVRLVLSSRNGGMLRVRSKLFDVVALAGTGVGLMVLAHVIPNQGS